MICIYYIQNKKDKKIYIGQTINFIQRIKSHKKELRGNRHSNDYLQHAWNKYSEKNFIFGVLEECEEKDLDKKEIFYINSYNSTDRNFGYNLEGGGDKNKRVGDETRRRMSENHADFSSGKHPFFGKHHSDDAKKRISEFMSTRDLGKHHSSETKMKISETMFKMNTGKELRDVIISVKNSLIMVYQVQRYQKN